MLTQHCERDTKTDQAALDIDKIKNGRQPSDDLHVVNGPAK